MCGSKKVNVFFAFTVKGYCFLLKKPKDKNSIQCTGMLVIMMAFSINNVMHTHTHAHTHTHTCIHAHTYRDMHACINTHIHTYIHT